MLRLFPLLIIPVLFYNIIAFGGGVAGHHDMASILNAGINIPVFSGDTWQNFNI